MARRKEWTTQGKTLAELGNTARFSTELTILRAIAVSKTEGRVLAQLVVNPATPLDVLKTLHRVAGEDTQVVEALASCPRTPPLVLRSIARGKATPARLVAYNPSATPFILKMLSTHQNPYVRAGVAWNWNTPEDVLVTLASDTSPVVQNKLVKNTHLPVQAKLLLVAEGLPESRVWLARGFYTETVVLDALALDEDIKVRRTVAWNKATPPTTLTLLAGDPVEDVRRDVARQPNTPPEVLKQLMLDPSPSVRFFAGKNPSAWN